jgi:hypothetical protein
MKPLPFLSFCLLFAAINCLAQPTIEWQKCLGGVNDDYAHTIFHTPDGGYMVGGSSFSLNVLSDVSGHLGGYDAWVIKFNHNGEIQWQKCLGGIYNDQAHAIQTTNDGGFIVVGQTTSMNCQMSGNFIPGYDDVLVVKINSTGDVQWQRCLGGYGHDIGTSIQQTSDGGYILAGYTESYNGDVSGNHGPEDFWVVKLTSSGDIQWQKCLGGTDSENAYTIRATNDGGYIVAGNGESHNGDVTGHHGNGDAWLVKLNSAGGIQWQKCLGGSKFDIAYALQTTNDGGYIVAGETASSDGDVSGDHGGVDAWIVKLNSTGGIQWQKCIGGSDWDEAFAIQTTNDGGYIMAGGTYSTNGDASGNHGSEDVWVVKLSNAGDIQWQKCLGGSAKDVAKSIHLTNDGGYVLTGSTSSSDGDVSGNHGNNDVWTVKLDSLGEIQWQKSAGGSDDDIAYSVQTTSDGGYITAGYTYSNADDGSGNHGKTDAMMVKLDPAGAVEWLKYLGGSNDDSGTFYSTTDGGYILVGTTSSNNGNVSGNHGGQDAWVVKLNDVGDIQWQKCLGGSNDDAATSVEFTGDGGYLLSGSSNSNNGDVSGNHGGQDAWIVKLNSAGDIQWQKCLGGSGDDSGILQAAADGGYIFSGTSSSNDGDASGNHGKNDAWIVKLNSTGDIQWQKSLGGSDDDDSGTVQPTADGGFILRGETFSEDGDVVGNHGKGDAWIIKLNSAGDIQWQKCLGGSEHDSISNIRSAADGGYILTGTTFSNNGDVSGNFGYYDAWVVKLNSTGAVQWQQCIGGSEDDEGLDIQSTGDGGYLLTAGTRSPNGDVWSTYHGGYRDAWLVKIDSIGEIEWQKCFGGSGFDSFGPVLLLSGGGYIAAGSTDSNDGDVAGNHGKNDAWVVKLGQATATNDLQDHTNWLLFPNPTTGTVEIQTNEANAFISISVSDVLGRVLLDHKMNGEKNIDLSGLPTGLYVVSAIGPEGKVYQKKIVKE